MVIWHDRQRLGSGPFMPSWSGILLICLAMVMLVVGQMGAELFLSRTSMLVLLAGLVVLVFGWAFFRRVLFPWAFLFMMIPIPAIIFNQITFPLQLLASRVATIVLPWFGVPILREGNVINLPRMALEVAEACSGIRSLMSLVTLAIIYGHLMERRLWVRWLLVLASVPIAVIANSIRIIGTGLLVQYWDPEKAEGLSHATWGWIIFVVALFMVYSLHGLVRLISPDRESRNRTALDRGEMPAGHLALQRVLPKVIAAALLVGGSATLLHARGRNEVFPSRQPLDTFPEQLGEWTGADVPIDKEALQVLGPGDFLLRMYRHRTEPAPPIDLFIAYFPTQKAGDTIHSPKNCLPGAGWAPIEASRVEIASPGHPPFPANRYVIAKGESRELVLYWYWAHDRGVASEYWAKYYLITDSMKMNRSDGSLVRLTTPLYPGERIDAAQQRLRPLVDDIVPQLEYYIPR